MRPTPLSRGGDTGLRRLSAGPAVVMVPPDALWQTLARARHGQLLLRSPGSGVRHRWL